MPKSGDANLEIQRAVIVDALIEGRKVDFNDTIANKLFAHTHKTSSALQFSCLITEFCRWANMPLINGVYNEVRASHKQDIEKTKNNSKYKNVSQQSSCLSESVSSRRWDFECSLKYAVSYHYIFTVGFCTTYHFIGSASMSPMARTTNFASILPQYS